MQRAAGQGIPGSQHRISESTGRLARRSSQADAQTGVAGFRPTQQLHHRAGLAGSRSTTEQHHRGMVQGTDRGPLLGIETLGQRKDRQWIGKGCRKTAACLQRRDNVVHRLQPTTPTETVALRHQGRGIAVQPTAGVSQPLTLRGEGNGQLPPFQGLHQVAGERFKLRSRQIRRQPAAEGAMQAHRHGTRPAGGGAARGVHSGTTDRGIPPRA